MLISNTSVYSVLGRYHALRSNLSRTQIPYRRNYIFVKINFATALMKLQNVSRSIIQQVSSNTSVNHCVYLSCITERYLFCATTSPIIKGSRRTYARWIVHARKTRPAQFKSSSRREEGRRMNRQRGRKGERNGRRESGKVRPSGGKGSLLTKRRFTRMKIVRRRAVSMLMPLRFLHFGSRRDKLFTRDAVIGMTGYQSITELPTQSFIA